MTHFTFQVA